MSMIEVAMPNNGHLFHVSYMADYHITVELTSSPETSKYFSNCPKSVLGDTLAMCSSCSVENTHSDIRIPEAKTSAAITVPLGLFFVSHVVMYNLVTYKGAWT